MRRIKLEVTEKQVETIREALRKLEESTVGDDKIYVRTVHNSITRQSNRMTMDGKPTDYIGSTRRAAG